MKQVFVIIWLGKPQVFGSFEGASNWLRAKVPYLTDLEIRMSIYTSELF